MVVGGVGLKVLHLATYDTGGGAAKASFMLQQELRRIDVDQDMLVLKKGSGDGHVIQMHPDNLKTKFINRMLGEINSYFLSRYFKPWEMWSLGLARQGVADHALVRQADVVAMSWMAGLLSIEEIARLLNSGKPVIWTLYDMWALTAGCHYSQFCNKYQTKCENCHQLNKPGGSLVVDFVWRRKKHAWKNLENLTIACTSNWLAESVRSSALLGEADIRVIPQGVDVSVFAPKDKEQCCNLLQLPSDKQLVLFLAGDGFSNERKGGSLLLDALIKLRQKFAAMPGIVVLGSSSVPEKLSECYQFHFPIVQSEHELSCLYSACDLVVVPSREDNLPLTLLEAMACGTPCCVFNIGGMKDVILHRQNGYMADAFDTDEFAQGIEWVLSHHDQQGLSASARETVVQKFSITQEAMMYRQLFKEKYGASGEN